MQRLRVNDRKLPEEVKWHLDRAEVIAPSPGQHALVLRGWILARQKTSLLVRSGGRITVVELSVKRPDVIEKLVPERQCPDFALQCGFNDQLPITAECTVGVRYAGQDYWLLTLRSEGPQELAPLPEADKVLRGRAPWLFLTNDSNRSIEQYTGHARLNDDQLGKWAELVSYAMGAVAQRGAKLSLLIAPAKEELFPEMYPFKRAPVTPLDQLLKALTGTGIELFPKEQLLKVRDLAYYPVDTHWSDYGAHVAAKATLSKWGLAEFIPCLPERFIVRQTSGDLGGKCVPMENASYLASALPSTTYQVFDNGIKNTGKVRIFQNASALRREHVLIFGDSFSDNLAPQLAAVFRRVVYAHTIASWDQDVFEHERPDFVLLQTNQRFLMKAPSVSRLLWDEAERKIQEFSENDRFRWKDQLRRSPINAEWYSQRLLAKSS